MIEVELFIAVLGASNYAYAEATHTQQVHDFVGSRVRAFNFFGGVVRALVPDNLKSGVIKTCFYEPTIQCFAEQSISLGSPIPAGWVIVRPNGTNANLIKNVSGAASGTEQSVALGSPIPAGWVIVRPDGTNANLIRKT